MTWLVPLGFIGLVGILVLILIYILKPNYQQKLISSTYIWKLSLKYRKKKLPVSKLRNLLILLCQILIIALLATILARPIIPGQEMSNNEKIVIIDSSASMLTTVSLPEDENPNGMTRYERAVKKVITLAEEVLTTDSGCMTIILAGETSEVLVQRATSEDLEYVLSVLKPLIANPNELACEFGDADIETAMNLAEDILYENPNAEVMLYTGTNYLRKNGVTVMQVSSELEWNVAVLDCKAELVEGYWAFTVEVGSYHGPEVGPDEVNIAVQVTNVNGTGTTVTMGKTVKVDNDSTKVIFDVNSEAIYSYDYARAYVDYQDCNAYDNSFYLYGGNKEQIKIQYASTKPNPFIYATLISMRDRMSWRWDLVVDEVQPNEVPVLEGYDFYIFENGIPSQMPSDGVVVLMNSAAIPTGLDGLRYYSSEAASGGEFTGVSDHPILNEVDVSQIIAHTYYRVSSYDNFDPILFCNGDPVMLVRNTPTQKIAIMPFSVHTSTVAMTELVAIIYNTFNYFIPSTATENVFVVNQEVSLNSRGTRMDVEGPGEFTAEFMEFPAKLKFVTPGTYAVKQLLISGLTSVENIFVHIDRDHSNVVLEVEELDAPVIQENVDTIDEDLIIWFAIALVSLLFIEWALHTRDFRRR